MTIVEEVVFGFNIFVVEGRILAPLDYLVPYYNLIHFLKK